MKRDTMTSSLDIRQLTVGLFHDKRGQICRDMAAYLEASGKVELGPLYEVLSSAALTDLESPNPEWVTLFVQQQLKTQLSRKDSKFFIRGLIELWTLGHRCLRRDLPTSQVHSGLRIAGDAVDGMIGCTIDFLKQGATDSESKIPRWETLIDLGRTHREFHMLSHMKHNLLDIYDPTEMYATLECGILDTFHLRTLNFALVNYKEQYIEIPPVSWHTSQRSEVWRYPLDSPDIICEVVRTGKAEVIDGWDPRYHEQVMDQQGQLITRPRPKSYNKGHTAFFIPIFARNKVIGVVATGAMIYDKDIVLTELDRMQPFLYELGSMIALMSEMAERRKVEKDLKEAKEHAEVASQAKSRFLANMSHEIRTPMSGMLGMIDLTMDTRLTDEQRSYLGMVRSSAQSLLTVLNDILDFSKIEAGKMDIEWVPFDVRNLLMDVLSNFVVLATQKGLQLNHTVASDVPMVVVGDPGRIRQILTNLVGNAIKFTEAGKVDVAVGLTHDTPFKLEEEPGAPHACMLYFTVQDTGIGIPTERQAMIFDAYAQVDPSTMRRFGGTGLGLSIVSHLTGLMGGDIWVESAEGKGSTFSCTIKVRLPEETLEPLPPLGSSINVFIPDLHVLIVEDNPVNQYFAAALLKRYGCSVERVHNGHQALEALSQKVYDLILMDVEMPVLNGLETTRAIREREEGSDLHLPIVAMTAHAMAEDRNRCLDAGMDEYITKPIQTVSLLKAIKNVLPLDKIMDDTYTSEATIVWPEHFDQSPEMLSELITIFLNESPRFLEQIRQAIKQHDEEHLERAAHTLKGAVKHFGARPLVVLSGQMEQLGQEKNFQAAASLLPKLEQSVRQICDVLRMRI